MIKDQKTYDLVYELLRDYPRLRSNDKRLLIAVWIREGLVEGNFLNLHKFLDDATPSETVTRARRQVQHAVPEWKANKVVQQYRDEKAATKGTFVYHERTTVSDQPSQIGLI